MKWKKDKLKPTQPYLVFDTEKFYQEVYLRQGISHFYSCSIPQSGALRVVPDGCIDLLFEYYDDGMRGFVCGTPLKYRTDMRAGCHDIFGVRFMPGFQPSIIEATMKEVCDKRISLEAVLKGDRAWLNEMDEEKDFYQRIRIFLEAYTRLENKAEKPFGKRALVMSVKQMVYESDGLIRVSKLGEETGYSERYINKVFIEEMGFSPKLFCKIIQFQRALEYLNYGAPGKMTDVAVMLGYYDQPQFIRDFTRYAGITPRKYLKLVEEKNYQNKVINSEIEI